MWKYTVKPEVKPGTHTAIVLRLCFFVAFPFWCIIIHLKEQAAQSHYESLIINIYV